MKNLISIFLFAFFIVNGYSQNFQDNFKNEKDGDFPAKWELIRGQAEVAVFDGNKSVLLDSKSIITPKLGSTNYLSDNFTLEFEAYFDQVQKSFRSNFYAIRFWEGTTITPVYENKFGIDNYSRLEVFRHGVTMSARDEINGSTKYDKFITELEDKKGVWRKITVNYNEGTLKVLIDDTRVLQIPDYKLIPKMISIEGYSQKLDIPQVRAIKNVNLTGIKTNKPAGTKVIFIVDKETNQVQIINGRDSEIKDLKAQLQSIDQRMKSLEVLNKTTQ